MAETFTAAELAKEAEREIGQRRFVYPRLIAAGKMTQAAAERQIAMMTEIARRFREQSERDEAHADLFASARPEITHA